MISLTSVVLTYDIFENGFEFEHGFSRYFKESWGLCSADKF